MGLTPELVPIIGGLYRHYRAGLCQVLQIAQMSNSDAEGTLAVVYCYDEPKDPGGQTVFVRTLWGKDGWNVRLDDGRARFEYVSLPEPVPPPYTGDGPPPFDVGEVGEWYINHDDCGVWLRTHVGWVDTGEKWGDGEHAST